MSRGEKKHISGIIQITRKATGYLAFEASTKKAAPDEDIEIQTADLLGALNGDTVEVELVTIVPRPKGKVVKVIERAKTEFVCTIERDVAIPADPKFYKPITLKLRSDQKPALEGTKALVRLLSFDGKEARGEIVETIGIAGEHRVEMNAIVMEHGFSTTFPPTVAREAENIEKNHAKIIENEIPKRADFRNKITFTIDPVDAKDFDDALSVEDLGNGEYEIGVHIADATYFCVPGTAIDDEAVKRGTSVYLVDATIPMLPHELSGNVCSLKADEDRLAFSGVFKLNSFGEVLERRFEKSIIRSNKRFTYEEAQEVLDK